jgi:hypothetical protein
VMERNTLIRNKTRGGRACEPCARAATWFMLLVQAIQKFVPIFHRFYQSSVRMLGHEIPKESFKNHISGQQTQSYLQGQRQRETLMTFKLTKKRTQTARV